MPHMSSHSVNPVNCFVANRATELERPFWQRADMRNFLREWREAKGLSQTAVGELVGTDKTQVSKLERGDRRLSTDWLEKFAKAFKTDPAKLMGPPSAADASTPDNERHTIPIGPIGTLPIRHIVAAGVWREIDEFADEPLGEATIMPRPDIEPGEQWVERVVGDSFDRRYPEGTLLHVRSAFGAEPTKLHGKRVIIERTRDGGHLRERTVKEIVVTAKGEIELWGRSFNPKWSKPIRWKDGLKEGDTVEIVGIVLSSTLLE